MGTVPTHFRLRPFQIYPEIPSQGSVRREFRVRGVQRTEPHLQTALATEHDPCSRHDIKILSGNHRRLRDDAFAGPHFALLRRLDREANRPSAADTGLGHALRAALRTVVVASAIHRAVAPRSSIWLSIVRDEAIWYVPAATSTVSKSSATSIAACIVFLAVAQSAPLPESSGCAELTYMVVAAQTASAATAAIRARTPPENLPHGGHGCLGGHT